MSQRSINLRKRFVSNVIANGAGFILMGLIGMWFTPYLINHLGIALYGLVPLATSVTGYLTIFTLSVNGAVGRFLTVDLERGDATSANATFNTSLVASGGLAIGLVPIAVGIIVAAPYVFNIPQGQEDAVRWLFAATMVSFLITTVGTAFSVSSWARNRFDLRNIVVVVSQLARVGIVVYLFAVEDPQVWHVGVGIIGATILGFLGDVIIWWRITPELAILPRAFDLHRIGQLFAMGGWLTVNQVGTLLFLGVDLLVVNMVVGAEAAGLYGSVLLWSTTLRGAASNVAGVLTPAIVAKYARGNFDDMNYMCLRAVKFMGLGMALPVGLMCGFSQSFLALWLGPSFERLGLLLVIMLVHLSINLAVLPLFGLQTALNKVRWPGIVTLLLGIVNIGLAIAWAKWDNWGMLGVAMAAAVVLTLKNTLFTPIYTAIIAKLPWWRFLPRLTFAVGGTIAVGFGAFGLAQLWPPQSWPQLLLMAGAISVLYVVVSYGLVLSSDDRVLLRSMAPIRGEAG